VSHQQNPTGLPPYIFATGNPLVAAWLCYGNHLQYNSYSVEHHMYLFYDPAGDSRRIIHELSLADPSVNMKRFTKLYKNLTAEKLRAEGNAKRLRREVRRAQ
jgi:hypothetical protein